MNAPLSAIEQMRFNMIEQQIRPWEVTDDKIISALFNTKRELFVPEQFLSSAFMDIEIPLDIDGVSTCENMLAPKIEARLAQELKLKCEDSVLEIGTGSGYQAALLAQLCNQVLSVEIDSTLCSFARSNLERAGITNVKVEAGDACAGWSSAAFNAILVTGSMPNIPDSLKYQLAVGGRLVAILGSGPMMSVIRITRSSAASFEEESLFETYAKPLIGPHISNFKF